MKQLLAFLKLSLAFIFNLVSIVFTCIAWVMKLIGLLLTSGADATLDLLNKIGSEVYE